MQLEGEKYEPAEQNGLRKENANKAMSSHSVQLIFLLGMHLTDLFKPSCISDLHRRCLSTTSSQYHNNILSA